MHKIHVGDLVWIPDGTTNYVPLSVPIKGPDCGLVMRVEGRQHHTGAHNWLEVQVGASTYMVDEKDVKRMNREETIND
tara:strand:+ start:133 stop:366 length:234 start_codon:yes stop_codon:yes gene_type:complete